MALSSDLSRILTYAILQLPILHDHAMLEFQPTTLSHKAGRRISKLINSQHQPQIYMSPNFRVAQHDTTTCNLHFHLRIFLKVVVADSEVIVAVRVIRREGRGLVWLRARVAEG